MTWEFVKFSGVCLGENYAIDDTWVKRTVCIYVQKTGPRGLPTLSSRLFSYIMQRRKLVGMLHYSYFLNDRRA